MRRPYSQQPADRPPTSPRVAVCLSSGFFDFFCHAGFLAGLEQDGGITPAALGGSSAGAVAVPLAPFRLKHGMRAYEQGRATGRTAAERILKG